MKAQHTPGPWNVDEDLNIRCTDTPDSTGTFVAEMVSDRCPNETKSNARLIAAAPELLSALIDITDTLEADHEATLSTEDPEEHEDDCSTCAAITRARQAIALAGGPTT